MATLTATSTTHNGRTTSRLCPRCELPTMHGEAKDLCSQCLGDHSKKHLLRSLNEVLRIAMESRSRLAASVANGDLSADANIVVANRRTIRRLRAKIKRHAGNFLVV